jgi:GT2 family glycosyltransferase
MVASTPKGGPQSPRISIIVVSYNSMEYLPALFASIGVYPPEDPYEIIVVDNASSDDTARWCLYAPLDLRLIVNHENRGFAAAANAGARLAKGEYLLFCNPDVRWTSPVADYLAEYLTANPACGAAAARMTFPDGRFQSTCRNFPTFSNIWFSRGSVLSRLFKPSGRQLQYTLPDYDQPTRVDAASATCLMTLRAVFNRLGGFDERYFMFVEDTDLCRRLAATGYKTWFIPQATAIHHWGGSSSDRQTVARYHAESIIKYFKKHRPEARLRNMILSLLLGQPRLTASAKRQVV